MNEPNPSLLEQSEERVFWLAVRELALGLVHIIEEHRLRIPEGERTRDLRALRRRERRKNRV